jgi:hypothetical protein
MKKCLFCAEEIQDAAIKCRYCGSMLDQPSTSATPVIPLATPAVPHDEFKDAREMAWQGHKIKAIKLVRDKTGWDLKKAKDFVESPAFGVPVTTKTSSASSGLGCLLLVLILVGGAIWWVKSPSSQDAATPAVNSAATKPASRRREKTRCPAWRSEKPSSRGIYQASLS